jgi:Ca-activated chloride channel family protein
VRLVFAAMSVVLVLVAATRAQEAFRSGVHTVAVYATVRDDRGRLVPDLTKEDFLVFDNGRRTDVTAFSNERQPITVALMLDMSGSMQTRYLRVRDATLHFVDALVSVDRARIGTFGEEVALSPLLTGDKAVLRRVIQEELWPGGATPLWQAIQAAMMSLQGETGRRVVLTLTDGRDTGALRGSDVTLRAVEKRARDDAFMVYAIGMQGSGLDKGVVDLADQSGGGHFELERDAELTTTFERVAEELRHQYLVGFTPAALDGKVHKLEVRLAKTGMTARARKEYVAAPVR